MDIGKQERIIIVEPEPVQAPAEEPVSPGSVPAPRPTPGGEPAPVRR